MKPYLLTSIFILLLIFSATAQTSDREVYPQQETLEHNNAVKSFSADYMTAYEAIHWLNQRLFNSTGNSAYVDVKGSENVTILSQTGFGITGIVDIDGSGNQTTMEQTGFNLFSILNIQGHRNRFDMTQEGSYLQNQFHIYGSGANMEAQQTNTGMNYHQTGAGTIPLSIQQSGRATPIIIRNY